MDAIDHPGQLYLGREYEVGKQAITDRPVFYELRHLTTHGIILGMTGSGKTGLGLIVLEEALLQGIPVLMIDPKGDLANLLLTFPDQSPEDFTPWVDVEGARRRGIEVSEYGAQEAKKWREGLAAWGISGERIARLRQAAEFTVFTPGSDAAQPVDVLSFFSRPDLDWNEHEEALRERIAGLASALLGLVGIEADPIQSPEHILISHIVEHVWRGTGELDLPGLIRMIHKPPFQQIGVFGLETFLPEKDRFQLARSLNNLVAAPGFEKWREGTPLEVNALLRTADGRPRASVFYLAHLNDAQKLFFITLLLEALRDWLGTLPGTTDLRAILYFDEVFGYFPPYPRTPASKTPLLALIKQGRARGLGVILATQNPVDLDYKGLTNAGTWIVGTLRTERDKERVLEGLEGAAGEAGAGFERQTLDRAIGALKPRVFLLHDIYKGKPVFFHTRWAMSYLRGPFTRTEIRNLSGSNLQPAAPAATVVGAKDPATERVAAVEATRAEAGASRAAQAPAGLSSIPPTLPPEVQQVFLPPTVTIEWALRKYEEQSQNAVLSKERQLVYVPHLLGMGAVNVVNQAAGIDHQQTTALLVQLDERATVLADWRRGTYVAVGDDDLLAAPLGEGVYEPVPSALVRPRDLQSWVKSWPDYLYRNVSVTIWRNAPLKLYSKAEEDHPSFRSRCEGEARRLRDAELKKARAGMDKRTASIQTKLHSEERELAQDEDDLRARRGEEFLTLGETALNLFGGRRIRTAVSRTGTKRRMTRTAKSDVEESRQAIKDMEKQLEALTQEWANQQTEITTRWAATVDDSAFDSVKMTPRRTDVRVLYCGLAWVPTWHVTLDGGQTLSLPAREEIPR